MKKQHFSFTLIELLVVIGIIALLAGLVMPAIGAGRASAKKSACLSNQGQTMKIITQSMNDNNQFLVSGHKYEYDATSPTWVRYLLNKNRLTSLKSARCPVFRYSTAPENGPSDDKKWEDALKEAYGVVESFRSTTTPAGTLRAFDFRGTGLLTVNASTKYQVSPGSLVIGACAAKSGNLDVAFSGMNLDSGDYSKPVKVHGDECNFFFLDGHAESLDKGGAEKRYVPREPGGTKRSPEAQPIDVEKYWLDPDED